MHSTIIISYFKAHKREVLYMYVLWDMASWSRIPNSTNKGALWSKFVNTDKKRLNCKRVGNEIVKKASTIYGFLARKIIYFFWWEVIFFTKIQENFVSLWKTINVPTSQMNGKVLLFRLKCIVHPLSWTNFNFDPWCLKVLICFLLVWFCLDSLALTVKWHLSLTHVLDGPINLCHMSSVL